MTSDGKLKPTLPLAIQVHKAGTIYRHWERILNNRQQPQVHILVLNYCSLEDTLACVETIRNLSYPSVRLLVIDNASPDGSGSRLASKIPKNEFIQLRKNIGYAGGNNKGMRVALSEGADFILILNPDVRLEPESLTAYVHIMSSDRRIGGLNAVQLHPDGHHIDSAFLGGVLSRMGCYGKTLDECQLPEISDTEFLFGAALMLSTSAIRRAGGFDPLYFAYGEETDLCRRIRLHGFRLVVTPKFPVTHLRTNYARPLSRRVLFLKLKGYYLSRIKNPNSSLSVQLKFVFIDLINSMLGRAPRQYPFDTYKYDREILLKAFLWFLTFSPLAWLHKRKERIGGTLYI